jgi:hypothetical protein
LFVLCSKLDDDGLIGKQELNLPFPTDRLTQMFARSVPRSLERLGQDDASPDVDDPARVTLTVPEGLSVPGKSSSPPVAELVRRRDPDELCVTCPRKPLTGFAKETLFDASLQGHVGDDQRTPAAAMRSVAWRFSAASDCFGYPSQPASCRAALRLHPLELEVFARQTAWRQHDPFVRFDHRVPAPTDSADPPLDMPASRH